MYLVTNEMLENVWVRLRDCLSWLDSSTSFIKVKSDYAAHFNDVYVQGHTRKHLTGDRIRILLEFAFQSSFRVSRPDRPLGGESLVMPSA